MKDVIDFYKNVVIQIATPYSTGTGFYLKEPGVIVTNEHVIRGNRQVVVDGGKFPKQLTQVLYTDPKFDLAFLHAPEADIPAVRLGDTHQLTEGEQVIAIGHPFGLKYTATQGIVSNTKHYQNDINYIQHDAALNPGNSGGPLVDTEGDIVGVNTFIIRDGNSIGFSLPVRYLSEALNEFNAAKGQVGTRCLSCSNLVFENTMESGYCPFCGSKIRLPSQEDAYEPAGVQKTIEEILRQAGCDIELSRLGPNAWEIQVGSARVLVSYYEKMGMITGDALLCNLPKDNIKPIYEFLLRENYRLEGLTLSVRGQEIILSLVIFDRYLNTDTGLILFKHLFEMADHFDDVLLHHYNALARNEA